MSGELSRGDVARMYACMHLCVLCELVTAVIFSKPLSYKLSDSSGFADVTCLPLNPSQDKRLRGTEHYRVSAVSVSKATCQE